MKGEPGGRMIDVIQDGMEENRGERQGQMAVRNGE